MQRKEYRVVMRVKDLGKIHYGKVWEACFDRDLDARQLTSRDMAVNLIEQNRKNANEVEVEILHTEIQEREVTPWVLSKE